MSGQGRRAQRRAKPRVTFVGVLGELLLTGGVLVLLFLGWQLWWNDMIMANSQSSAAASQSEQWLEQAHAPRQPVEVGAEPIDYGAPVVSAVPGTGESFAVLFIPRFGEDYKRVVAEGVGIGVLNSSDSGIGHYPGTQMPGELGNFAVASHRSANGGGMHVINEFQLGDPIYVQTADGWFTYRYRDLEYVQPSEVSVIAPVPRHDGVAPTQSVITLTSCNPLYSTDERIIAYGVLESWQPASAGPPSEVAAIIATQGG